MSSLKRAAFVLLTIVALLVPTVACNPPAQNQTPVTEPPPEPGNSPPVIISLAAAFPQVQPLGKTLVTCEAKDPDGDNLTFKWNAAQGALEGNGDIVTWTAPQKSGQYLLTVVVTDGKGGISTKNVVITVPEKPNNAPSIQGIKFTRPGHSPITIKPNMTEKEKERTPDPTIRQYETADISCMATDPDKDDLSYAWFTTCGTIKGKGATVQWIAPSAAYAQNGNCTVTCEVTDGRGGTATFQLIIIVKCCGA
jgi:hypothetical protein